MHSDVVSSRIRKIKYYQCASGNFMNWIVLIIILILTIIAAFIEYICKKNFKAVAVLVIGIVISVLSGHLFSTSPEEDSTFVTGMEEYQVYYTEMRNKIDNAVRNREHDLGLDYLMQLANTTKSTYGENSLELGVLYAEIGELCSYIDSSVDAKKYVDFAKDIVSIYTPDENNYMDVAKVYKCCGDVDGDFTKSIYFYNMALSIMAQFNDTASQLNANIYVNLSDRYLQENDHVNALKYAEKAKNLYETYLGTTYREAGITYCLLGNIYTNRNHIKALDYYQKAEMVFKNNAPDDDSFLAICYSGMGNLYLNIDQKKCYEYCQAAWNLNKSIFGELHKQTIQSEIAMAVLYRVNGDSFQAKLFLEEALLKAEEKYGSESKMVANIYTELGNIADSLQECLYYYDKAELIFKQLYGESHVHIAYIYADKSVTYYMHDDFINAKIFYDKAVNMFKDKEGSSSPELAYLYVFMGNIYCDENEYVAALEKFEDAKQIYDLLYGESNINSALCCYKMACLYSIRNQKKLADELFEQAIEVYELTYGEYSFQSADLYYEYAKHLYRFGDDINKVIRYTKKAVDLVTVTKQENFINQAQYCFTLGCLYMEVDNTEKSLEYLKECVRILEYNELITPLYIEALSALAQQYSLIEGEYSTTLQYVDKAISAAIKAGSSEDLCAAYYHTAIALGNIGEYEKALEYLDVAEQEGLKVYDKNSNNIEMINKYRNIIVNNNQ